ncbi:MAG: O-antigen ligase family protein [Deltaproteobacteria bacterium]|nr:O-antigen ligase family protein [Deltaproteobacteria bacterium]
MPQLICLTEIKHSRLRTLGYILLTFSLAATAFILPFKDTTAVRNISLFSAIFFLIAFSIAERRPLVLPTGLELLIPAYIGWAVISALTSPDTRLALSKIRAEMIMGFLFLYVPFLAIRDRYQLRSVIYSILAVGFLLCATGIVEYILSPSRIKSVTMDYNFLSSFLVMIFPLTLYHLVTQPKLIVKALSGLFLPAMFAANILTSCRAAWIAMVVQIVYFGLKIERKTLILFVLGAGLIGTIFFPQVVERVRPMLEIKNYTGNEVTIGRRLQRWSVAWEEMTKRPLLGVGFGRTQVYPYFSRFNIKEKGQEEGQPHAHNTYLDFGMELGFPGLLLFLAVLAKILHTCYNSLNKLTKKQNILLFCLILSIIGFLIRILFDDLLYNEIGLFFWFLTGIALRLALYPPPEAEDQLRPHAPAERGGRQAQCR